jgi:NAD(P)-dependent dehydrogenase (short-subunit alcohol dehydrogenase family)
MATAPGEAHVDLTGQVALVTGGGRGLGRAFALALAAAGAQVAVTARTAAQVAETVQLIERAGGCALAIPGDVSVPDAVAHVVTTTAQQLGPVDLLVNNAGFHVPASLGYDWEVDPEAWWHTFEINLRGPFLCARAVLPGMIQCHRGRIVNVSSHAAFRPRPQLDALCTSKAALTQWTRCLALSTQAHGIAVFAFAPGLVRTVSSEYLIYVARCPAGTRRHLPWAVQPGRRHPDRACRANVAVPGLRESGRVVRPIHPCGGHGRGASLNFS